MKVAFNLALPSPSLITIHGLTHKPLKAEFDKLGICASRLRFYYSRDMDFHNTDVDRVVKRRVQARGQQ
jgi:hypothetical protein